jgi:hypothetical protein
MESGNLSLMQKVRLLASTWGRREGKDEAIMAWQFFVLSSSCWDFVWSSDLGA